MRIEPDLANSTRTEDDGRRESHALVPVNSSNLRDGEANANTGPEVGTIALKEFTEIYDVGAISPREMVDLSLDLYISGYLTKEQYRDMAFQSELLPNFGETIGALTGERAEPDRPRDYVKIWRSRLSFEEQHSAGDERIVNRTRQILDLLMSIKPEKKKTATSEVRNALAHIRPSSRR
ncbi:MAG: hypothetical protein O3A84_12720 [Proteobacteria bacterium]|nr:hypothetical protein [Pseudomonadota bacterium]